MLTEIPRSLTQGDIATLRLVYAEADPEATPDPDVLTIVFAHLTAKQTVTGTPDEDGYLFTLDTTTWGAADYQYQVQVSNTGKRQVLESGCLHLGADLANARTTDGRSYNKRMLDAIEALLEGRALSDVQSYTIKDRSLEKMELAELERWRAHYAREYAKECAPADAVSKDTVHRKRYAVTY